MRKFCLVLGLALTAIAALAADGTNPPAIKSVTDKVFESDDSKPKPDKSRYTLLNPVPRELMREMSTDRPDLTESPYTVDAGHFQIESSIFDFNRDRRNPEHDGSRSDTFIFGETNFKIGLLNNVDFQFVFDPYIVEHSRSRNSDGEIFHETRQGFGDVTTRLKINLWGNDGGKTAFGFMPFVKIPTNQENLGNNNVEGGLIVPLAVALPLGWDIGLMTELDVLRDEGSKHYHTEFLNTATFGHNIYEKLGGYVEFAAQVDTRNASRWAGYVDCGLSYGLTENIQFDVGVNIGVTRPAADVNPFIGISLRF